MSFLMIPFLAGAKTLYMHKVFKASFPNALPFFKEWNLKLNRRLESFQMRVHFSSLSCWETYGGIAMKWLFTN